MSGMMSGSGSMGWEAAREVFLVAAQGRPPPAGTNKSRNRGQHAPRAGQGGGSHETGCTLRGTMGGAMRRP
jgi:hypothetical protein